MSLNAIPSVPPLDPHTDSHNVGQRWERWINQFEFYLQATGITNPQRQKGSLLHCAGRHVQEIFKTITTKESVSPEDNYVNALDTLDAYFKPKKNVIYERFQFNQAKKAPNETVGQYEVRLRDLGLTCDYDNLDQQIRDHIIQTSSNKELRLKALCQATEATEIRLETVLKLGKDLEQTKIQAQAMSSHGQATPAPVASVYSLHTPKPHRFPRPPMTRSSRFVKRQAPSKPVVTRPSDNPECRNCGFTFEKGHLDVCKARNQACRFCKKIGHFEKKCLSKARQVQTSHSTQTLTQTLNSENTETASIGSQDKAAIHSAYSEDEDFVFPMTGSVGKPHKPHVDVKVKIAEQVSEIGFLIDSGSTVNILLYQDHKKLICKHPDLELTLIPSTAVIKPFNSSTPVKVLREFTVTIETCSYKKTPVKEMFTVGTFQVVEGLTAAAVSILGRTTAIELGMLRVGPNEHPALNSDLVAAIHSDVSPDTKKALNQLLTKYDCIFQGVGKLKNYKHILHTDPSVEKHRRLPFHQKQIASNILKDLRQKDIIEKVPPGTPITHLSNIHLVPKDNDPYGARFTVDLRNVNKAIQREHHVMPTFEQICDDLQSACFFCKADMQHGYFQIELDESSRNLTCFSTHEGYIDLRDLLRAIQPVVTLFNTLLLKTFALVSRVLRIIKMIFFSMPKLKRRCLNTLLHSLNGVNKQG